ncbi:hypothetical protein KF913_07835 [Candidatus Obscuribacterales bacterium]|nr:hypothetical protein [Candidatus Obscuribacterales bacterium]
MSSKGKFSLHPQDSPRRGLDLALLTVSGLVVIALLSALTINLLDQSQRHVEKVRQTHVPGPSGSKVLERENEADILVQEQVNKNLQTTEIAFEHYELTDAGLKYVGKLTNLKNLSLGFTRISDSGIKYLVKLPLESLSLCSTDITDGALDHIARIKTLRYLNLSETNITDEGIQKLRSLGDLNDLHLMATNVSGATLRELVEFHQPLWKLVLTNTNISDDDMPALVQLENLEWLTLDGTRITGQELQKLGQCKKLRTLGLVNCDIKDSDVKRLVASCPTLETLDLSRTNVTGDCLVSLANLKRLKRLVLNRDHNISPGNLKKFRERRPDVNVQTTVL